MKNSRGQLTTTERLVKAETRGLLLLEGKYRWDKRGRRGAGVSAGLVLVKGGGGAEENILIRWFRKRVGGAKRNHIMFSTLDKTGRRG